MKDALTINSPSDWWEIITALSTFGIFLGTMLFTLVFAWMAYHNDGSMSR